LAHASGVHAQELNGYKVGSRERTPARARLDRDFPDGRTQID